MKPLIVFCSLVEDRPTPSWPSIVVQCVRCGQDVWMARRRLVMSSDRELMPVCTRCMLELYEDRMIEE